MSRRNKPLAAQQPAPAYGNDPEGFWQGILNESRVAGISSLLPGHTVIQSDVAVKSRLLRAQIGWMPCAARWEGCNIQVSLSDAQFALMLEAGGDTQQGQITVLLEKLQFGGFGKGLPAYGDTIDIQSGGVWHAFTISQILGQHDDNEPGLTVLLDKDQNAIGD